tara:strand:+ start:324 stop:734 length:411 start_codon:yes stop_codon:yes gene_type:complete
MDSFVDLKIIEESNYNIVYFKVNQNKINILKWTFFMNELKNTIELVKYSDKKIGFLFDIKNLSFIDMKYLKEFINLMKENSDLLENKLLSSCVIDNTTIIKTIMEAIKVFYTTKKEIIFVKDFDGSKDIFSKQSKK